MNFHGYSALFSLQICLLAWAQQMTANVKASIQPGACI